MKRTPAVLLVGIIAGACVCLIAWRLFHMGSSSLENLPERTPGQPPRSVAAAVSPLREAVAGTVDSPEQESPPVSVWVGEDEKSLRQFEGDGWSVLSLVDGSREVLVPLKEGRIQRPSNEVDEVLQLGLEGRAAIPLRLREESSGAHRLDALWFDDHLFSVVAQESGAHLDDVQVFRCWKDIRDTFRSKEQLTLNASGHFKVEFLSPIYDKTHAAALTPRLELSGPQLDSTHGSFVLEGASSPIRLDDGLYWVSAPGREWRVVTLPLEGTPRLELRQAASIEVHWSGVPEEVLAQEFELLGESGLSLETREVSAPSGKLTFDRLRPGGAYRVTWYRKLGTGKRSPIQEWPVYSAERPTLLRATYSPPPARVKALVEINWPAAPGRSKDALSLELRRSGRENELVKVNPERIDPDGIVVFKERTVLAGEYHITVQPIGWTREADWRDPVNRLRIDLSSCQTLQVGLVDARTRRRISNPIEALVLHCRDPEAPEYRLASAFLEPQTNPFSLDVMPGLVHLSVVVQGYRHQTQERLITPGDREVEIELRPIAQVRLNVASRYADQVVDYPEKWLQQVRVFDADTSELVEVLPLYVYHVGAPTPSTLRVSAEAGRFYQFVFPPLLGTSLEPLRTMLRPGEIQDLQVLVDDGARPRNEVPVTTEREAAEKEAPGSP